MNALVPLLFVAALLAFSYATPEKEDSPPPSPEVNGKIPFGRNTMPETAVEMNPAPPRKKRNMSAISLIPFVQNEKPFRFPPSHHGNATFYTPAMGACGKVNTAKEMVMAVSKEQYGQDPKNALVCGICALVKADGSGKQVKVRVVDRCVKCAGASIDLSPAAFQKLASKNVGHIQVTWEYAFC
ncbi:uncharacterized protein LOC129594596 [Paramacrobiotus metropolitanus]|uniref:uncharacterized protein LOC129594596 n=1 Tax=Paramacrobiotus metropolitanus TaxID=2943436 RepID=UPI0024460A4E|nr:uncharacterized protein LOC129594596 [Paramacrobiotus metropolitanus]